MRVKQIIELFNAFILLPFPRPFKLRLMNLRTAHGPNPEEIAKFRSIDSCRFLSIGEYVSFGSEGKDLRPFRHTHECYEFLIPLKTVPLVYYEKANYIGEVGFCYPINPMEDHGTEFDLADAHLFSIAIDKQYLEGIVSRLGFKGRQLHARFPVGKALYELISRFQQAARSPSRDEPLIDSIAESITVAMVKEAYAQETDLRRPEKKYAPRIKEIVYYMYRHYPDPNLTIAFLAKKSGYSLSHFSRVFKAFMHDSPVVHLNKLRLSEAKRLFFDKSLKIKDIAEMVGYRNASTFTEAFRVAMGMNPLDYRKKYYN